MISYVRGDATRPLGDGPALITHVCNDRGGWGRGFVLAISNRWRAPEKAYREWFRDDTWDGVDFALGEVLCIKVDNRPIHVVNMLAQVGYGPKNDRQHRSADEPDGDIPLRYDALESCLLKVSTLARDLEASVHMPRVGCGLAGGTWDKVGPLVEKTLADFSVTVYDYP